MTRTTRRRTGWSNPMTLLDALAYLEARQLASLTPMQCVQVWRTGNLMLAAADGVDGTILASTVISLARHVLNHVKPLRARPKPRKPNQRRRRGPT
jgi:hypothetical protein